MSNNKVEYFPLFGRAEFIRAMFYHAGEQFENCTIEQADWPAMKADTSRFPLGSMPVVTLDGNRLYQSKAAARAVAIKFGYYSDDPEIMWQIDSILDFNQENNDPIIGYAFAPEKNEEGNKKWLEAWQKKGDILEARLKGHGKKFIAGTDTITLADFSVAGSYFTQYCNEQSVWPEELRKGVTEILNGQPNL